MAELGSDTSGYDRDVSLIKNVEVPIKEEPMEGEEFSKIIEPEDEIDIKEEPFDCSVNTNEFNQLNSDSVVGDQIENQEMDNLKYEIEANANNSDFN